MAKTRSFSEDKVLFSLLHLFRKKGYIGTSLKDIEHVSKLKPGSIYNAFGSKNDLFIKILDLYNEKVVKYRVQQYLLNKHMNPIDGIKNLFLTTFEVKKWCDDGCLLTNTAIEKEACNRKIINRVKQGLSLLEDGFVNRIKEAKASGLIAKGKDANLLAKQLLASYQGILVMVKLGISKKELRMTTDAIITSLTQS